MQAPTITLAELRKTRGWSQAELARRLTEAMSEALERPVSPSTIANWELGRRTPSLEVAKHVAALFDVCVEAIAFNSTRPLLMLGEDEQAATSDVELMPLS